MTFEENVLQMINESNAARRAIIHPARDEYLLNQKVKPMKKIILSNSAVKQLIKYWHKDSKDPTGKIMLDPTSKGYGGNGVYGVWESVRGLEGMYADIAIGSGGEKWSFTELWLTEEGAKKLQNNIRPLPNDFYKGENKNADSYRTSRRKKGLRYAAKHKEEVKQDMSKLHKYEKLRKSYEKEMDDAYEKVDNTSDKTLKKTYEETVDRVGKLHRDVTHKGNKLIKKYVPTGIETRDSRGYSYKKTNRYWDVINNFAKISNKLDYYHRTGKYADEAWDLIKKINTLGEEARKKINSKEVADKIDKLNAEVDNFIKKHPHSANLTNKRPLKES